MGLTALGPRTLRAASAPETTLAALGALAEAIDRPPHLGSGPFAKRRRLEAASAMRAARFDVYGALISAAAVSATGSGAAPDQCAAVLCEAAAALLGVDPAPALTALMASCAPGGMACARPAGPRLGACTWVPACLGALGREHG